MTANPSIDPAGFLAEQLERAEPDLLRAMLKTFVEALMGAEADAICGAPYGARSQERTNSRNGYRPRDWDTRAGTMEVAIPKLRNSSYFPDWLLERRRRAERALTTVVATCYLLGVSTRRMEKLVETLGITRLSKSQVSIMARELDEQVESFRSRPLDAGPYTFVAADALVLKVRERPGGQRARAARGRGQRRWAPGDPRGGRHRSRPRRTARRVDRGPPLPRPRRPGPLPHQPPRRRHHQGGERPDDTRGDQRITCTPPDHVVTPLHTPRPWTRPARRPYGLALRRSSLGTRPARWPTSTEEL